MAAAVHFVRWYAESILLRLELGLCSCCLMRTSSSFRVTTQYVMSVAYTSGSSGVAIRLRLTWTDIAEASPSENVSLIIEDVFSKRGRIELLSSGVLLSEVSEVKQVR